MILLTTEQDRHPGYLTLPLVLSVAAIILLNGTWLNSKNIISIPLLRVGLVSYSAYLVHWPLVVFYKIEMGSELEVRDSLILLLATYVLAELLYRFVEQPTSKIGLKRLAVLYGAVPGVVLLSFVFFKLQPVLYKEVNPAEFSVKYVLDQRPERKAMDLAVKKEIQEKIKNAEGSNFKKIIVLGDSHSGDITWAIQLNEQVVPVKAKLLYSLCDPLSINSITIPIDELYKDHYQKKVKNPAHCATYHKGFIDMLKKHSPDLVIFSDEWSYAAMPYVSGTIRDIKENINTTVLMMSRTFTLRSLPETIYNDLSDAGDINNSSWERRRDFDDMEESLQGSAAETGSYFLSKNDLVCPNKQCDILINGEMGYMDNSHWSAVGFRFYGERLAKHPVFIEVLSNL